MSTDTDDRIDWIHCSPYSYRSGLTLRAYPDGVEIDGWYDTMVGLDPGFITWDELAVLRKRAKRRKPYRGKA